MLAAGILSAAGVGSYAGWTARADERPATFDANDGTGINVDSLYTAKAEESNPTDSSFVAEIAPERTLAGRVSWYGPGFNGRRTASGERFDKNEMTAAHKTLPFNSLVRVVDVGTGRAVLVRINDRGPYCRGRIMDLSEGSARRLGITGRGSATARMEIFTPENATARDGKIAMTFDLDGRALVPHGYSVKVAEIAGFDEAIALQHTLQGEGHRNVYLTQIRSGNAVSYEISIGLFSSKRLCGTLLAEINSQYSSAEIVRFQQGARTEFTTIAKADSVPSTESF